MKIQLVFRTLSVLILVLVSLAATQPAFAASPGKPYVVFIPVDEGFTWYGADNPCGFDLQVHFIGTSRITFWVDSSGRTTRYLDVGGSVVNETSANGKTITSVNGSGGWHVEFISENQTIYKWPGAGPIFVVPGYGKVMGFGAGLTIEIDTFDPATGEMTYTVLKDVGTKDPAPEDFAKMCAYLAP